MAVLSVKNVRKTYHMGNGSMDYAALSGVSFEVDKGEFVGIMGPSGAGKSTLLNVIATIDNITSGTIKVGTQDISYLCEPALSDFRRKKLGFIFQDYNLLDTLTLKENIALPLILAHKDASIILKAVKAVAKDLGIDQYLNKYPYQVSGGQRQRASAARAIIHCPELILADEPTGALDSKSASDLLQCLQMLNTDSKVTILMVTHDAFAASFCQRILFIKDGKLYTELEKTASRKQFYDEIMQVVASLGGDNRELL